MTRTVLTSILILAATLRVGAVAAGSGLGHTGRFYYEYRICAEKLVRFGALTSPLILDRDDDAPSSLMPPGYAVLVAGVYSAMGVDSFAATLVLQLLNVSFGCGTVLLAFGIGRRLSGDRAGLVAAGIAAAHPVLIAHTELIWDTRLFEFLAAVCVWWSVRIAQEGASAAKMLGFGGLLGFVALVNPGLTLCYPVLVLYPLLAGRWNSLGRLSARAVAGRAGLAILGWALVVSPWIARGAVQFGRVEYVRSGLSLQLWLGVCPEVEQGIDRVFKARFPLPGNEALVARVAEIGEHAFMDECRANAVAAIREDPGRYARLVALRTVDYFLGTVLTHAPRGSGPLPKSKVRLAGTVFLSVELLALVVLFVVRRPIPPAVWMLGLCLILFSLVYLFTQVQIRYRAPMEIAAVVMIGVLVSPRAGIKQGDAGESRAGFRPAARFQSTGVKLAKSSGASGRSLIFSKSQQA